MPIDPEKFKQDSRSPQELAKAILDHEYRPRTDTCYGMTFREQLLHDDESPSGIEDAGELLWPLKTLEAGILLRKEVKSHVRHALQVIDAYRKEATKNRDMAEIEANPNMEPRNALQVRHKLAHGAERSEAMRREAAEWMGSDAVAISNLKSIEKLTRALADKLRISLIEPRRHK